MLTGLGRAGLQLRLAILLSLVTVATVGGGVRFGLEPTAAALGCGVLLVCGYYLDQLARDLKAPRRFLLAAFAPAALAGAALTAAVIGVRELVAGQAPLLVFVAALAAGGGAYLAVILIVAHRRLLADVRAYARIHEDHAPVGAEKAAGEVVTPAQAEAALSPAG
jgi:ABC-type transport system involved in cytochrome c biogenesis permease subunit